MILECNYEELRALTQGASAVLGAASNDPCAVAAPPASRAHVEALLPRLSGAVSISTLSEQREVEDAVRAIVRCLHAEMNSAVLATHPADEGAVAAYFDYAHALAALHRLEEMGEHMRALIEIVAGTPPTEALASTFSFPD